MMMLLWNLVDKFLSRRAKRNFLKSVIYKGSTEKLEIMRRAHVKTFRGSKPQDIVIGDDFRFFGGYLISQNGGKITIGTHTKIGFDCRVGAAKSISIGDYVIFADNITVMDNNNHPVNPLDRAIVYRSDHKSELRGWKYSDSKPIVIGNNVWVGSNVRINKGVTIGEGAVIAANTVVTKDVPANCICAGNPGKIVKTEIDKLPRLVPDDAI